MSMKKSFLAVFAALCISGGCEYHPYYDGQEFRVYCSEFGLLEAEGEHIYVPLYSTEPYALECYGGKGKNHSVEVADPGILGYSYAPSGVDSRPFDSPEILPASVLLEPLQYGNTSISITDGDTGESVTVYVHICEAAKAIEVYEGNATFETGTVFAFRYGVDSDVVNFCRGNVRDGKLEQIAEGRYAFLDINGLLHLELSYPADENGKLAAEGRENVKLYQVTFNNGASYGTESMMAMLNMQAYPVLMPDTKVIVEQDNHYSRFCFIDVTGRDPSSMDSIDPDIPTFYAYSARLIPWLQ